MKRVSLIISVLTAAFTIGMIGNFLFIPLEEKRIKENKAKEARQASLNTNKHRSPSS